MKKYLLSLLIICLLLVGCGKKEEKWVQKGNTISKGDKSYKIGDYYDYDETNNGKITNLADVKWRVFGVEDGKLLIMSTSNVNNVTLGHIDDLDKAEKDYFEGKNIVNRIASQYGKGKNAVGARSITIEDMDKIMGFDKNTYAPGPISKYGNVISYYWVGTDNPMFKYGNEKEGELRNAHKMFIALNVEENKFERIEQPKGSEDKPVLIANIKNDFYAYSNSTFDKDDNESQKYSSDSSEYKMLFLDEEGNESNYYLASNFSKVSNAMVGYGYWMVKGSNINFGYLLYSMGHSRELISGVRVIVTIK